MFKRQTSLTPNFVRNFGARNRRCNDAMIPRNRSESSAQSRSIQRHGLATNNPRPGKIHGDVHFASAGKVTPRKPKQNGCIHSKERSRIGHPHRLETKPATPRFIHGCVAGMILFPSPLRISRKPDSSSPPPWIIVVFVRLHPVYLRVSVQIFFAHVRV